LKTLKKENVKGTFFSVGYQLYRFPDIGQQILDQGSDIGLHTYSHYENPKDNKLNDMTFRKELDFSEKIFAYHYGFKSKIFRVPYLGLEDKLSYNSLQYINEAYKRNYTISAPTVDAADWDMKTNAERIEKNATTADVRSVVVLFHDAGGNRNATIKALPNIIQFYRSRGYRFTTVSEYAKENNLTYAEPLSIKDKILITIAYHSYNTYKHLPHLISEGFLLGFILVIFHTNIFLFFAIIQVIQRRYNKRLKKQEVAFLKKYHQLVTVIIPMYNEAQSIGSTMKAVLMSSYRNIEVLVVDDGSTDNSIKKAIQASNDKRVRVLLKNNGGKSSALNYGLLHARGKIIITIDADTRINRSAIMRIIPFFHDKKVGAVAGTILIGNKKNIHAKLQSIEYILNQSIEKRVSGLFNSVMVIPGAFGAWRVSAVRKAGGFTSQTLSEDFDLTMSIIKKGYYSKYCEQAVAYTEAPLSLSQLISQRLRWNFGNLQVYFKHRDMIFKKRYGFAGLIFMPRAIFLQIPFLILTPFVDLFIITNLLVGERTLTAIFFLLYIVTQLAVALVAYTLSGQPLKTLMYIPFLRFPYTQILYFVFYITLLQAVRGELISWRKMYHTGILTSPTE
jgi:cellulose synthase/poly-beta-1,6-N-acetylglucosamine synthase-like glycosyltransferase/peptidoglycan/xylan/chitin deacetylase (PgdA/CDA1 family)